MPDASVSPPSAVPSGDAPIEVRDGAKALVSTDQEVLLVKEVHSDGSPFWTLPGGGISEHETVSQGLRRELDEELRTEATVHEPVTTIFYKHRSRSNTMSRYRIYTCSLLSDPEPNPEEGVFDYQWVSPTAVPTGTLPPVRYALQEVDFA